MRIVSINHLLGSQLVSNENVLEQVRAQSTTFDGNLEATLRRLKIGLDHSGFSQRGWFPDTANIADLTFSVADEAIGSLDRSSIEAVLFVGVGRHFLEPASAALLGKSLGVRTHAFDLTEACQSWTRAAWTLDGLYRAGFLSGRALVVNCEVHAYNGISGARNLGLRSQEDLAWNFGTYTMGDAISATVFEPSNEDHAWQWSNLPELADRCTLPLAGAEDYLSPFPQMVCSPVGKFACDGEELHRVLAPEVVECTRRLFEHSPEFVPQRVFTHSSSPRVWKQIVRDCGLDVNQHYCIGSRTGNLVSASVPTALSMAEADGSLLRGMPLLVQFGSAGGSAVAMKLTY